MASWSSGVLVAFLLLAVLGSRYVAEVLECLLEQRDAQLVRAVQPVARLVGLLVLWVSDSLTLHSLLCMDLAVSVVALVIGQRFLARRLRSVVTNGDAHVPWAEIWSFTAHLSVSQLLIALGDAGAVRLLAGRVLGTEGAGVFAFLQQLMITANRYLPSTLLANVVRPMLVVRHAEADMQTVGTGIAVLWKLNLILMCGAVAITAAGGDGLMMLLSGGAAQSSGLAMVLLLIALLGSAMSQVAAMAMQIHGQAARLALISASAPVTLLLAWLGGTTGGLFGLVIGVAASMWIRGAVVMAVAQSGPQRAPLDWAGMARVLFVTAALAVGGVLLAEPLGSLPSAVITGLAYPLLLRWLQPLTASEGELMARALGRRARWLSGWSRAQ